MESNVCNVNVKFQINKIDNELSLSLFLIALLTTNSFVIVNKHFILITKIRSSCDLL
jgi:hypothetical protein